SAVRLFKKAWRASVTSSVVCGPTQVPAAGRSVVPGASLRRVVHIPAGVADRFHEPGAVGLVQCRLVQSVTSSEDRPVADSAVTPYVFLDTEVFRTHQLDFQSPNIRRLVRLAVEGPLRLLLTTVTKGEVMDDL